ncbi:cytochrome c [bacterium AH-315-K20]|nr:cytochrome c [bacterium AH-315-K20]
MTHGIRVFTVGALAALAAVPLTGCRGDRSDKPPRQFFPGMDDQPRWKPQAESEFFADGRTMRKPVQGTIPFGTTAMVSTAPWAEPFNAKREEFLAADSARYEGVDEETGDFITTIPIPVTSTMLSLGQTKFNIYCAVCHGYNGEGSNPALDPELGSMVGRRWSIPVANLHDPKFREGGEFGRVGYIYSIVRDGKGVKPGQTMSGYAYALDSNEAWAVVAYVRALQRAQQGTLGDVPESERSVLGAPPPPPVVEPQPEGQSGTDAAAPAGGES